MKRIIALIAVVLLVFGIAGTNAVAADVTTTVDFVSAYVWRGITFNDGFVVQPSVDVSHNGFGFNVWGNFDVSDNRGTLPQNSFSEVDLTLSYTYEYKILSASVGVIEYLFPGALTPTPNTHEAFVSLDVDVVKGLSVGVAYYYDYGKTDGSYATVGASYGYDLTEALNVSLAAYAAYASQNVSAGAEGGMHDYNVSLSGSYAVTKAISMGAFIAYTGSFDTNVLPEQNVDFYGGFNVSYAF
jgi:uncharacterized protein (TIGR02001 family)